MYYSLKTYIYLYVRNYFLNVLLFEDIHIFTCEELLSECTALLTHIYIYMRGTIVWVLYSLRTYIYLHVRNYFLNELLSEDIHIFTWEELLSECTTLWWDIYIYMWGTIVWMYYSLRTYIYLHARNYCLNVLLSEDMHIFTCEELFSECTTLWGHTYITCEELLSECTTLCGHTYIYMWGIIFRMYNSLRTDICLHVRNYFLNILLSEDINIFVCEELLSECTNLWEHTSIYMWGAIFWVYYSLRHAYFYTWRTIFWVYYSLRTYMYLLMRNYFLSVLLFEDINIFTCEEIFSECTILWGHTNIYTWGTIFWIYYSLRTYIYLHARSYCLSALISENILVFTCEELFSGCTTLWDIHIFTCEELFSECTTLWGHTCIYMWGTNFWVYYSLRTYIYLHVRNYFPNVLLSEDIHIFTCEELFSECTTLWENTYIYM